MCDLENPLTFPSDQEWEVGLKEYHYINNIDTITRELNIHVGGLHPYDSKLNSTNRQLQFPHYFTECGTSLTFIEPFKHLLLDDTVKPPRLIDAFHSFIQKERLLNCLRVVIRCAPGMKAASCNANPIMPWLDRFFKIKMRNTTEAVHQLYPRALYGLAFSYPLALALDCYRSCFKNSRFRSHKARKFWNSGDWIGGDTTHFDKVTLITSPKQRQRLAPHFRGLITQAMGSDEVDADLQKRIDSIQHYLDKSKESTPSSDYWMTVVPFHRLEKHDIQIRELHHLYSNLYSNIFIF